MKEDNRRTMGLKKTSLKVVATSEFDRMNRMLNRKFERIADLRSKSNTFSATNRTEDLLFTTSNVD